MAGTEPEVVTKPRIVGRSSSSFTRVTRIFAAELGVACELEVAADLLSSNVLDYGGNPALKLPSLKSSSGVWFGALNVCRALARSSTRDARIVWPEDLHAPQLANAQELTLHALATEVALVMSNLGGAAAASPHQSKMRASLQNVLTWLDTNVLAVLAALPVDRDLSYLEVTLFCLVTHLQFRQVAPVGKYPELAAFCARFGERGSARETLYRFDS